MSSVFTVKEKNVLEPTRIVSPGGELLLASETIRRTETKGLRMGSRREGRPSRVLHGACTGAPCAGDTSTIAPGVRLVIVRKRSRGSARDFRQKIKRRPLRRSKKGVVATILRSYGTPEVRRSRGYLRWDGSSTRVVAGLAGRLLGCVDGVAFRPPLTPCESGLSLDDGIDAEKPGRGASAPRPDTVWVGTFEAVITTELPVGVHCRGAFRPHPGGQALSACRPR